MLKKCNSKTSVVESDEKNIGAALITYLGYHNPLKLFMPKSQNRGYETSYNDYPEFFFKLSLYVFFFLISVFVGTATASPVVVSTNPVNGTTGISQAADMVSITFDKPMNTAYRSVSTSNWNSSFFTNYWSEDGRTLYLPRQDSHYPFVPYTKVIIMINQPGYENIRDTEGNLAEAYNFTFWIESINYQRVDPQPEKGFNWPYLLYVPKTTRSSALFLVEPNNSGAPSDDFAFHEERAKIFLNLRSPFSYVLGAPLLIPIFPRYEDLYTQALDRPTLLTNKENLVRIDLQLIAMVDDAIERLASKGIKANKRFLMIGFSASGAFVSRFSVIHPERIMAAAIGSPGGWPIAPVAEWRGHSMTYDLGISDLNVVAGKPFNLKEFKRIPLYLYLGDMDDNWDSQDLSTELHFLGETIQERWVVAEDIYQSIGSSAKFVLYPGVGHTITNDMWLDIEAFLIDYRKRTWGMPWLQLLLD